MTKPSISPVVVAIAAGAVCGALDAHAHAVDIPSFIQRGDVLLSGAWASTFAEPALQAGPLQVGMLALLAKAGGLPAVSIVLEGALAGLFAWVTGRVLADRPPRTRLAAQLGVVAAAAAIETLHRAYADGHPAQVATPLLWTTAALVARRGRAGRAGLLVGLTACFETWGLLGLPVLFLGGRRGALRGVAGAAAVVALAYGPFALFGQFRMLDYSWQVMPGSPASLFLADGSAYTWWLRILQGAAALSAGVALAVLFPGAPVMVWVAPLAVVVARLAFEPVLNDWYLIAVQTTGLVAAADLFTGRLSSLRARSRAAGGRDGPPEVARARAHAATGAVRAGA